MVNAKIAVLLLVGCVALACADPTPPCKNAFAPTFESMCSTTLFASGDISIKQYGLPKTETLVVGQVDGSQFYVDALPAGAQYVLEYFLGDNDERRPIPTARTVPFTVRPPSPKLGNVWSFAMMASTALFPDPFKLPTPLPPTSPLAPFGQHLFAVMNFSTPIRPYQPDFIEACNSLISQLPSRYKLVNSSLWTPTWVLYNGQATVANFTNECWVEVEQI